MSVLWEIPLNFSSTHVHLPLNYTFSSVICQKMDSGPTRLEEWWEWMRQREGVHSTESLAPFISQISTFNLLFRKKLKIWLTTMSLLCHTDVSHCSPAGLGKGMEVIWQSDAFFVWSEILVMLLGQRGILWILLWEMWKTAVLFDSQKDLFSVQGVTPSNLCKDSKRRNCGQ